MDAVSQNLLTTFGNNVRQQRLKRKLTQLDLATMAEIDIRSLQRIEKAEISIRLTTAYRVATALVVPLGQLLKGD